MAIQIISNIDEADVARLTRLYNDAGAISVTPAREPDGQVSLIVVYPDSPHPAALAGGSDASA